MGAGNRGFTLLETLVAVAISVAIGYLLIVAASSVLRWTATQAQRDTENAAIGELVDRWTAEEDSAWAIFTPPADVFGASNVDGHELDFFTRDGKNQSYFWAYNYDAQAKTLTRYLYSNPGAAPAKDATYGGISKFIAHTYPVTALQDASTPIHSALYDNATLHSGMVHFYPGQPWIAGGNNITYVRIEGTPLVREMQLVTQTAPTGFTIVLRYTPAPSPTPAASLQAWPPFVELPMNGQALQTAYVQPRRDFGFYLNRFFGGATAQAALSPCAVNQGRAFQDSGFSAVDANDRDPFGLGFTTDASGCINGPGGANVALYEAWYTGTFIVGGGSSCGPAVKVLSYNPANAQGPTSAVVLQGNSAVSSCYMTWTDQRRTPSTATVGVKVSVPNTATLSGIYFTQPGNCDVTQDPACMNLEHDRTYWYAWSGTDWVQTGWHFYDDNTGDSYGGYQPPSGPTNYSGTLSCTGGTAWNSPPGTPPNTWELNPPFC